MIDEATIKAKRDELVAQREKYITEANQQIAMFNGAIAALEQLITPQEDKQIAPA